MPFYCTRVCTTKSSIFFFQFLFYFFYTQTSSDGNSTTSVLTFVPVKPSKLHYQESNDGDEPRTSDYDGRLTCRAENPQHQQSTSQRKHTIATGSDSSDGAGTPFIQSTWLLRIQCEYNSTIVLQYIVIVLFILYICIHITYTRAQILRRVSRYTQYYSI